MQKKICMLGTSAVGKTSLVARFIEGIFSDNYLTTIGVKISRKQVASEGRDIDLLLWDINGEDRFQALSMNYLRGAAGYLLVADGTRRATLDAALSLHARTREALHPIPFVLVLNKHDLRQEWEIEPDEEAAMQARGWVVCRTSAKTGTGVDEAFISLAQQLLP